MKLAFLFSGQGSQTSGMGEALFTRYPALSKLYECGADVLGYDLKAVCFSGDEAILAETRISQPAIFVTSLAALYAARENGICAQAVAGHSLGEYAAMVAAGMLTLEDGFRVIGARANAMQDCAERQNGAMYALLGSSPAEVEALCAQADGYVEPVNYNAPAQTVIAGEADAAAAVAAKHAESGKRAVRLNVRAAFHSKLMQPASDAFLEAIRGVPFQPPTLDVYRNLTGKKLTPEELPTLPETLAAHISAPVRFTDELSAMTADGVDAFVELGPGKVLTGLVKRTCKGTLAVHIEDDATLDKAVAALRDA